MIHHLTRTTRILIVLSLAFLAAVLSAARIAVLKIEDFRGALEAGIGTAVEKPVKIGKLGAKMRGFNPELVLSGVGIAGTKENHRLLQLREIRLGLNLFDLLVKREFRPVRISVIGARLSIRRRPDGSIAVAGLKAIGESPEWLLADGRFEILDSDIDWQDQKRKGPLLHFSGVDMTIENEGGRHRLSAAMSLPAALGDSLKLMMDFRGNLFGSGCCSGRMFVEGEKILLAQMFAGQSAFGVAVGGGRGNFRLWSDWQQSRLVSLAGRVDLDRPVFSSGQTAQPLSMQQFSSWFRWRRTAGLWRLDVTELSLNLGGNPWPPTDFSIEAKDAGEAQPSEWRAAFSYLRLQDAARLLAASGLPDEQRRQYLTEISPRGEARSLTFVYGPRGDVEARFYLCGDFSEVAFNPWRHLPGVENLSGSVCGTDRQGEFHLASGDAAWSLPKLLRAPLPVKSLAGRFLWSRESDGGWRIEGDSIELALADLSAGGRMRLVLPAGEGRPLLEVLAEFGEGDVVAVPRYLPAKIMAPGLVSWLDEAFVSGRIRGGRMLFYGDPGGFPYPGGDGAFQARIDVEKVELAYHPKWPHATLTDAELFFDRSKVMIGAEGGSISGAAVESAEAEIADFAKDPRLDLKGRLAATVEQGMAFLEDSPLRGEAGPVLKSIAAGGLSRIDLALDLPLTPGNPAKVDGTVRLENARMAIPAVDLTVEKINGSVHFSHDGVSAEAIDASILGAPARIALGGGDGERIVRVTGRAAVETLAQHFPGALWRHVDGDMGYDLILQLPPEDAAEGVVHIASDLEGLKVSLPAPLGKSAEASRRLLLDFPLSGANLIPLRLNYDGVLRAGLWLSKRDKRIERGEVVIGAAASRASGDPGLGIFAKLDEAHWDQWRSFLTAAGAEAAFLPGVLRELDLNVERLFWQQRAFGPLSLRLERSGGAWRGEVENPHAKGRLQLPLERSDDGAVLAADFDYLRIPESGVGEGVEVDPASLPGLSVKSRQVIWRDKDFGVLEMEGRKEEGGLRIEKLSIAAEEHTLDLKGAWSRADGEVRTHLQGNIKAADLGKLLTRLEVTKEIKGTKANVDIALEWPGAPWDYATGKLKGSVGMELGEGRLLGVEPGIGRALGVLNLDTWQRRLRLNFSDLFGEGLAYDRIKGRFAVADGHARTDNLSIDAVSARIGVTGRLGLLDRDFDQTVMVTPKSTASLPVVGALAGGPAVGAAIFVAQKLIGDNVDIITSTQYALTGSWDDPVITRLYGKDGMLQKAWTGFKEFLWMGRRNEDDERGRE